MDSQSAKNREERKDPYADPKNSKLGKRLAYLLRYGAVKEGLTVSSRGYVKVTDIMTVPLLSTYSEETLVEEFDKAVSERGHKRYEMKTENGVVYVRSIFSQRFERYPYHEGTKVVRLLEMCLQYVTINIADYSLEGIMDEYIISDIVRRLKRSKRLNNTSLASVLSPDLEQLDLSDAYLTMGSLKMIMTHSPNLKILNLKFCGYLINDELLKRLMKNLPHLINLNVCQCTHLTGLSLRNVAKLLPAIQALNVARIENFKEADILKCLESCKELRHLDIYQCNLPFTDDFCTKLVTICQARPKLKVIEK
ncbi:uncharacterized protein LOC110982265 isoform X2 [Acanthaster planci]|uniref:2'-phosphotransferase n=1 Tax=Acanthaster planci TaxID=133434 RepID=A0A8B7YUU3_ACAPL|nr:uncharacterized protein LOC110982265 isoform X2 [Acanthaster planci]